MIGEKINLCGFQSTSLTKDKALEFGCTTETGKKSVLLQIQWQGRGLAFRMNNKDFSAMPQEKEILL